MPFAPMTFRMDDMASFQQIVTHYKAICITRFALFAGWQNEGMC